MARGWRILQAMKKVTDDVGSTEMKVWHKSLNKDFDERQFFDGIKACQDHLDFLTLPHFRNICRLTKSHKSHEFYKPEKLENLLSGEEISKRIAKMRQDLKL